MSKESLVLPADFEKRADALGEALHTAIGELAGNDPRAAREAVQRVRERLDEAEAAVIRTALERCHWRLSAASELLGYPRPSALQKLVEPGRRHEAIGKEISDQREASGYKRGRPPAEAPPSIPPAGQKAPSRRGRNAPRG